MLFRYKCGRIKEINKKDFLNDIDYYKKILEIKTFLCLNETNVAEKDKLIDKITQGLKY